MFFEIYVQAFRSIIGFVSERGLSYLASVHTTTWQSSKKHIRKSHILFSTPYLRKRAAWDFENRPLEDMRNANSLLPSETLRLGAEHLSAKSAYLYAP